VSNSFERRDAVTVTVPAHPEYVHVLRAVAASVASRARVTVDAVDDLRLAVTEAASRLLAIRAGLSTLTLEAEVLEDRIELAVRADAPVADWPPPGFEQTLAWTVMTALVDAIRPELSGDGPALRLVKRTLREPATS
jgi:serine/threonine-protein kinase RsbW